MRQRALVGFRICLGTDSAQRASAKMTGRDSEYFFKKGNYGFRLYDPVRDEEDVCRLCWSNALPGGRPFPLIPEAGAVSFGRVITGPFARFAPEYFFVADDLTRGKLIAYLTGAEGSPVETASGKVSWLSWRDGIARQIAEEEFGEISPKLYIPAFGFLEGAKFLRTLSLGTRAVQFLLHAKSHNDTEMPEMPQCPEFHFHVEKGHRGEGIGSKLIEHFVSQFAAAKYKNICAQVTVCEGQKPLDYYQDMSVDGQKLWKMYDRRETTMYNKEEKTAWNLGPRVENVTLVADKERLLAFVKRISSPR